MKVVLINPPRPYLGDQKRNQSLGIMYLAAVLEQEKYEVALVDLSYIKEEDWIKKIPEAEVYGISAATPDYPLAVKIAQKIKEKFNSITVLGGVHATAQPDKIDAIFNKVVIGEGEWAILELLKDIKKSTKKRFYQKDPIEDLDRIPFPARHLLPYDSIVSYSLAEKGKPATAIIISRGCPYNCSFCASKVMWGQRVRFRSPGNVIKEIRQVIKDYGVYHFRFQDDTLTQNRARFLELCKKMEPLGIQWRCNTRVNYAEKEMLNAMKKAGCQEVGYGIESASQEVLDINNKKIKVEQAIQAVRNTKTAGLKVRLFFMIGLPGESSDISKINIDFIRKTKPDGVDLSTFVPFPGCDIYKRPGDYGIKKFNSDYSQYVMTVGLYKNELEKDFVCGYSSLTNEELKRHRKIILEYIKENSLALNK